MLEQYEKIDRFLTVCNDLIGGKFILADNRISELLKLVAGSKQLTDLFSAVTERFDYTEAKASYLRFPASKGAAHGIAYMPSERTEALAFVFCLLVEIDSGALKLNDFLLRYFYEDGSYTASYALFAERMLRPFRDIVSGCFPQIEKAKKRMAEERQREGSVLEQISTCVITERARIANLTLSDGEKAAGELMLSEMLLAVGREDAQELRALVCGYAYYLRANNAENENSEALFALARSL